MLFSDSLSYEVLCLRVLAREKSFELTHGSCTVHYLNTTSGAIKEYRDLERSARGLAPHGTPLTEPVQGTTDIFGWCVIQLTESSADATSIPPP